MSILGFQICSQSCKFSRVRVATVTHALKAKDLFMKYACCMSLQEFFGQGFIICSQNCNFDNKEIVRKKTLLQLYYNSLSNVKNHMLPHLQPVFPWPNCNWRYLQSESFTITNLFHVLFCFSIFMFILDTFPNECILMIWYCFKIFFFLILYNLVKGTGGPGG